MMRNLALAALSAAILVPTARAQTTATKMGVSDPLFAAAAGCGGLTELTISELGEQKATDPELKTFSQKMILEHTKMNGELAALAAKKQIALPKTLSPGAAFCSQSLSGLSGEEFDACYAKAQLTVHMEAVATFTAESERGQDPEMRALATKALPHIKDHLQMIKPIAMKYEEKMKEKKGEK